MLADLTKKRKDRCVTRVSRGPHWRDPDGLARASAPFSICALHRSFPSFSCVICASALACGRHQCLGKEKGSQAPCRAKCVRSVRGGSGGSGSGRHRCRLGVTAQVVIWFVALCLCCRRRRGGLCRCSSGWQRVIVAPTVVTQRTGRIGGSFIVGSSCCRCRDGAAAGTKTRGSGQTPQDHPQGRRNHSDSRCACR